MKAKATAWTVFGPLVGIVLGGFLGMEIPAVMTALGFIGDTFIGGLTVLSLIVAVTALFNAVSGLGDSGKVKFAFFKNLGFWGMSIVLGMALALVTGLLFLGGRGTASIAQMQLELPSGFALSHSVVWMGGILVAIALGLAANSLKTKVRSLVSWFKSLDEILEGVTGMVMAVLPVGLVFVVGNYVARDGYAIRFSSQVGSLILTSVVALALFGLLVLPLMISIMGRVNPIGVYGKLLPAVLLSLGSMSSRLALPLVVSGMNERKESDSRATGLAVSLGTLFNVAPTVMVVMIAVKFMAATTGVLLPVYELVLIGLITVGLSIGIGSTAGAVLPLIATALTLTGNWSGLSSSFMLIVAAVWLIEPLRAVVTSLGDGASAAVLSETFEFKTALRSPTRTAPRRFGDKPEHTERRGRPTDRTDRGRDRKDDSRDRKGRDRGPSDRPDDRRGRKDGRERRPVRDQRNDVNRTERTDRPERPERSDRPDRPDRSDNRRESANRQPSDSRKPEEPKPATVDSNSPFAMKAVDPALEMGGAPVVIGSDEKTVPDTSRESGSDQDQRRRDRRSQTNPRRQNESRQGRDRQRPDRRPQDRNASGRVPTVNDNKPDDRTESKVTAETEIPVETRPSEAITESKESLTRDRIQYELARVSQQLRNMDERLPDEPKGLDSTESDSSFDSPELTIDRSESGKPTERPSYEKREVPPAETPKAEEVKAEEPKREEPRRYERETVRAERPDSDDRTDETFSVVETQPAESSSDEETADNRSGISDEEKQLAASFGRSRDRRGPRRPAPREQEVNEDENGSSDGEPVTVEARNTEADQSSDKEIEFGRSRKKKRLR